MVLLLWLLVSAQGHTEPREFDIPQASLKSALLIFGQQADMTVVVSSDVSESLVESIRTRAEPLDLLTIMLKGSGLGFRQIADDAVVIEPVAGELGAEATGVEMDTRGNRPSGLAQVLSTLGALLIGTTTAADTETSGERVIEEVVVTATKRATSVQDTPLSITAFTTDDLYEQGIENFDDLARGTPGVVVTGPKLFQEFSIRGIQTTSSSSSLGEQKPVMVYHDEVPVSSFAVVTPDLTLYDIERVEVLRGPQGTTFGSGSMAGAVRVITNKADPEGFDASLRLEGASTRSGGTRQRYSGMVNLPVTETAALRLVGYLRDEEGYVDNIGTFDQGPVNDENYSEEWGLRASLRVDLTDSSTVTLNVMHEDVEALPNDVWQDALGDYRRANLQVRPLELETQQLNLTYEHAFPWGDLVSSTTFATNDHYWDLDLDAIFGSFLPFGFNEAQSQEALVQELRLVSSLGNRIDWLAGAFYLDREVDYTVSTYTTASFLDSQGISYGDLPPTILSPGVEIDPTIGTRDNTESAVFGELIYRLSDTLSVSAGIRYTRFEFEVRDTAGHTTDILGLVFGFAGGNASSTPRTPIGLSTGRESAVTTRFTLQWEPQEAYSFYLTAAEGFRRPHPNIISLTSSVVDPDDPTFIPEVADSDSLWSYEAGAKLRLLDGRFQANLAAYFVDWQDIQLGATRPSDGAPFTTNGGDVEAMGFEAELLYYPSERLDLGLNLTLADSEVVSLTEDQAIQSGQVEGESLTTPELKASLFAEYTHPLRRGGEVFGRLDLQYTDEYPNAPRNIPGSPMQAANPNFSIVDDYENINLQIGWRGEKLRLALYAENLLDNDDFVYINPDVFTLSRFRTLRPRTLGLRMDWNHQ